MELDEEVREFLIECNENLGTLDQEIVLLEQRPKDAALISSVFRTIHTIKGTCGFFGFGTLGGIAHVAENLLGQVRNGQRELTPALTALILQSVDAIKRVVATIEACGEEGEEAYTDLRERLTAVYEAPAGGVEEPEPQPKPELKPPPAPAPRAAEASVIKAKPQEDAADKEGVEPQPAGVVDSTIRVDVLLLDKLMNLVGELVLARNQLLQGTSGQDLALVRTVQRLNVITSELQEGVLKTRMQPIGVVWNKLPRVIRDLAAACGKKIHLIMEGSETELDKTIIEAIKDPLTHLVRNACDHGIETPERRLAQGKEAEGTVSLRAFHEGGHVHIEISDDGGGLNAEKLKSRALERGLIRPDQAAVMTEREAVQLVFEPGFSTAEQVTAISGRGVGMDVVKTNIQKIGGIVDLANRPGVATGSTVKIKIPLTLAIIPGLVITANRDGEDCRFVIPQANLLELVRLEREQERRRIEYVNGTPVFRRREQLLPLTYLNRVLGMGEAAFPDAAAINIVVLQAEDRPFGLVVDGICDTQEIVVKPLGKRLKGLSSYLGATIMGDGRVALILDIPGLARLAGMVAQARDARVTSAPPPGSRPETRQSFLIFRAGSLKRLAVPLALVARLEQFPREAIQFAGGRIALHYRDQILPLLDLASLLAAGAPAALAETVQVIVLGEGAQRVGVVVCEIVDIIQDTVTFRQSSKHVGLLGSAILAGAITDLLDFEGLLLLSGEAEIKQDGPRVLVLDGSGLRRTMVRSYLEMQGLHVTEAATVEAAAELGRECQVLVAGAGLEVAGMRRVGLQHDREAMLAEIMEVVR